ncbi:MAG: fimbrillin family protein, partial [Tannerella sp.]|nr:fimbrillin family protein [Tannerella sp.]
MEATKKELSMRFIMYTCCISAAILILCVLTFLLSSCTEELIDGTGSIGKGKKVAVQFLLGDVTYNGHEVLTRSHSDMDPGTAVIPLQEGLYMHATLEVDKSVKLRSAKPLEPNTKLYIAVYMQGAATAHDHADYTIGASGELIGPEMMINAGSICKFVAWSYNNAVPLPAFSETVTADHFEDLLWGVFPADGSYVTIPETGTKATLTMTHKFSLIQMIEATTALFPNTPAINDISNVTIPGKKAKMNVADGILTSEPSPQGDIAQRFVIWSNQDVNKITVENTEELIVYTGNPATTTLQIGSVTLNISGKDTTFNNIQPAIFQKQLMPGYSYTLKVNFRKDGGFYEDSPLPTNMKMYVGAFWKANQTGERLIRI